MYRAFSLKIPFVLINPAAVRLSAILHDACLATCFTDRATPACSSKKA
jgi:hypothetical protein